MDEGRITYQAFMHLSPEEKLRHYDKLSDHDKYAVRVTEPLEFCRIECNECKYYRGFATCDAFPDGIPKDVLMADSHPVSCNGKDSIHFEPGEQG